MEKREEGSGGRGVGGRGVGGRGVGGRGVGGRGVGGRRGEGGGEAEEGGKPCSFLTLKQTQTNACQQRIVIVTLKQTIICPPNNRTLKIHTKTKNKKTNKQRNVES